MPKPQNLSDRIYQFLGNNFSYLKWVYQLISYKFHQLKKPSHLSWNQFQKIQYRPSKRVTFPSGSLKLVGDLYLGDRTEEKPVILLLHGSSVFGRKLPLIQALSQEFQQLGYSVFAFDARGYGESEKPQEYTPESLDFSQDVPSAIDFLSETEGFANRRFYVIGHSFGGGVALGAQARDSRIEKVAIFGPPRRLSERFLNVEAREKIKLLVRWQGDMQLDRPLGFEMWSKALAPLNIENYAAAFSTPGHTPLFIIDAEDEPPADLAFLKAFYQRTVEPTDYWTVPQTNHYLDSGFRLNVPYYYPKTVRSFVERIDRWE